MFRKNQVILGLLLVALTLCGCSSTRYVPNGSYLLSKNVVEVVNEKGTTKNKYIDASDVGEYIKQRPNKKALGIGFSLGFYNMTDSSKHDWWHNFWRDKVGSPPVIFDSMKMQESVREMKIFMASKGYLRADVTNSVVFKNKEATVVYKINQGKPYTIAEFGYNVEDPFLKELILPDSAKSLIKEGDLYNRQTLINESKRITNELRDMGFYFFGTSSINYTVDSTRNNNTVSVEMNVKRKVTDIGTRGEPIYTNHPLYRISRIIVNTNFDPTKTMLQNEEVKYKSMTYKGIEFLYVDELQIKPEVLFQAVTISPSFLFNQKTMQQTIDNLKDLGFSTTMLFTPLPLDHENMIETTYTNSEGEVVAVTTEMQMECLIQCTPIKSKSISGELEVSTTAAYSSLALTLGYQNRNLFKGAENLSISMRGAYELMSDATKRNSYELGVVASLSVPRFIPGLGLNSLASLRKKSTQIQFSYNIQERPDYHRNIIGMQFGYNWTTRKGARISLYPIDINVVRVPWIDPDFLASLGDNNYLKNSYESQLIAGLSASYYLNSNIRHQESGYALRMMTDVNGNLLSALNNVIMTPASSNQEDYYTLFGMRYSQYARASIDYSSRHSFNDYAQVAWRGFIGVAVPYGNSSSIPFERKFFAGGGTSMRGWQIRSLGPGESSAVEGSGTYANQLGDMRLEFNLEYRLKVWGGLSMSTFVDVGNIWTNSKDRKSDAEMFRFNTFYRQLAMNTGLGLRWDFDFFLFRLDWGIKLHNPGLPQGERWFKQLGLKDTALHFALGLPF